MHVQSAHQRVDLPEGTREKLETFRRRLWWIKIGEGILAGFVGLMLSYALVFALDRFWDTPAAVRAGLLVLGALGLGILFPFKLHRWVWRTRQLEQVARLLRHKLPRLGDQLLGIVELAHADVDDHVCSTTLVRAAVKQVDREIADRDFKNAVPNPKLRAWGWAAAALAALVVAAFLVVPAAGTNALVRWLTPWRNAERYTFAQLDPLPNSMVVPYAEEFSIDARLSDGTAWSPSSGSARYGAQDAVQSDLADGGYRFNIAPQKEPDSLTVSVGDARKKVDVRPTVRPELTGVQARVSLPSYLQYSSGLVKDVRGGTVSLVKGSLVSFHGTATRPLDGATLDGVVQPANGNSILTAEQFVNESTTHELTWQDNLGLSGKKPLVISVRALEDESPSITCSDLAFEQVILDEDVLTFEIKATDDYGVQVVGMEWAGIGDAYRNPNPVQGEKLLMAGEPEKREVPVSATFSAKREGIPPQSLRLRMYTVDYLPDRKRIYSPTYTIHVLSPEEHAIWLTRQLGRWFRQAQEVYEKEQLLYQANVEIRALSPEEIDQPENRRRIEKQASAEQMNARRLEAVSDTGEQLIRQAMKNNQFNVPTLEAWAEMLNALRDIAQHRMPSVADLLAKGASAPAAGKGTPKDGGSPSQNQSKSNPMVGNNRDGKSGGGGPPKTGETASVPGIADVESGFNEIHQQEQKDQSPTPASSGRFTLPVTTLVGGGPPPGEAPPRPPAQENVAQAVEEQQGLLDEFARVAEELQRILDNLEGSTFVKRFKAASRRQTEIATDLNTVMLGAFGIEPEKIDDSTEKRADRLADREFAYSDTMWNIQGDLKAYYNRVRDGKFKVVLDEMDAESPVNGLADVADSITGNLPGRAIASAEYWADTFDRWAEQLVGPACPNGVCPPGKGDSMPPHLVLEVMQILEKEINLREETRAVEQARPTLEFADFSGRARALSGTQAEIAGLVVDVIESLRDLPNFESFGREIALLSRVHEIMGEATDLLAQSETGPPTIAAETEAIELLLQAKRINPGGGGGGGLTPGGGGGGDTEESAIALLGAGAERDAHRQARVIGQATGAAGAQFPAEFRTGLDAFFGALEGTRDLGSEE